ncbi:Sodium/calcium exchanger 1 isoform X18 [Oopsacas minuta]|uniref:Sodium/calcium exchanger 1 isoform X18 n=1 Tax=Oopsacas minuta TaxID=111878 RepID=A0AAV7KCG6_9METZ|nr:Sodium/calcium exchanger 1 isoform X18 [Oopsacas minuta]
MAGLDKNSELDLTDQSLKVEISDALSEQEKVKFTIHTKTTLKEFKKPDFTVIRDHDEFIWLHEAFLEDQTLQGFLIPPPPPIPDFEEPRYKLQRLSENEATYTKEEKHTFKAEIEAEYLALFKRTVSLHEMFLQRLAAHPKLRNDHNFHVFLEFDKELSLRNKNTRERINTIVKGFSKSFDENVKFRDHKDVDSDFEQEKTFYSKYHNNLVISSRSARKLSNSHCSVAIAILHVANNLKALSTMEYTDCNRTFQKAGETLEKIRKLEHRAGSDEELKLADFLSYYAAECQAALDLLLRRTRAFAYVEKSSKALEGARAKNKAIEASEAIRLKSAEVFETISENAKKELAESTDRRIEAYRKYLGELAELQIKHAKAEVKILKEERQENNKEIKFRSRMGNTNGTCNLQEDIERITDGSLQAHLREMCRCPQGGTFLRDYAQTLFTFNYTQPCGGGVCNQTDIDNIMGINDQVLSYEVTTDNSSLLYTASNLFPICYETFTGKPNQGVEAPFLIFVAALVYLLVLLYMFVGVALIADRFMASIEVITSVTRKVELPKTKQVIEVRVWNDTVSNLTLMALGSSAPEILLSLIELVSTAPDFLAGSLGPSTIVGSAAFNLLIISAVIVSCIPKGEVRKIRGLLVFAITAFFSIFAYLWLLIILLGFSPNVIEIWEALVTLMFFPLLVVIAYLMDKKFFLYHCVKSIKKDNLILKLQSGIMGRGDVSHGVVRATKAAILEENFSESDVVLKKINKPIQSTDIVKDDEVPPETQRLVSQDDTHLEQQLEKLLLHRVKMELKHNAPDNDSDEMDPDAQQRIAETLSHKLYGTSRAAYRVNATRFLTGGKRVIRTNPSTDTGGIKMKNLDTKFSLTEGHTGIGFSLVEVSCLENCGHIELIVERQGDDKTRLEVDYATKDMEAKAGDDYEACSGTLLFESGQMENIISVKIVDDDELSEVNNETTSAKDEMLPEDDSKNEVLLLENKSECIVSILDDDHHGKFEWHKKVYECQESDGVVFARIQRTEGARGRVSMRVVTIRGTAKPVSDYIHVDEIITFEDEETFRDIEVKIIDDDEYEKQEEFYIRLSNLKDLNETSTGDGAAFLGDLFKCTVEISEDHIFKSRTDKILSNIKLGTKLGTRTWRHQFKDALYPNGVPDPEDITMGNPPKPTILDWILHILSFPFKILFALVPPPSYLWGWPCFVISITVIGLLTAVIGDMAGTFGCSIGLRNEVTAITLVAIGTSLPDTFASMIAATNDDTADNSIGNITGSNSVNVFLGVGLAWCLGALVHAIKGTPCGFVVPAGSLAFSVLLFCICAVIYIGIIVFRRVVKPVAGAELGGPLITRIPTSIILVCLWLFYIVLSSLQTYEIINPPF